MRLIGIGFALLGLILLLASLTIVVVGLNDHITNADLIIVPGNTIAPDGTPSPRLKARLDVAYTLFRDRRAPRIFVSGGIGAEGFDESESMATYLVKLGVPSGAIIKDKLGIDTAATAANASRYIRGNGLRTAMVATQYFHVARTRLALERQGITVVGSVHARYVELRDIYSVFREVIGYVVYFSQQ